MCKPSVVASISTSAAGCCIATRSNICRRLLHILFHILCVNGTWDMAIRWIGWGESATCIVQIPCIYLTPPPPPFSFLWLDEREKDLMLIGCTASVRHAHAIY